MAEKKESLSDVLSGLRNSKKDDALEVGAFSGFDAKPKGLTTGNITLDSLTGIGGFPAGRITELLGPPSSGKTTSALQCAAKVQKAGGNVAFFDFEHALDPVYCEALGLDVYADSFIYAKPDYFEQGANAFRRMVRTGELQLGIFDSVAAMVTKHELEADTGQVTVADRAKMLHQFCRQLRAELSRYGTGAIFLNHLLPLVDATPMGRKLAAQGIQRFTSPGGKALPYYASMRVEFKQTGNLTTEEVDPLTQEVSKITRQTKTQAVVVKNKVADPFRKAELRVRFGQGFSQPYGVLSILTAHKVIAKSGSFFTFKEPALYLDDDHAKVQGEENLLKLMEENPDWFAQLEKRATQIVETLGVHAFDSASADDVMDQNGADVNDSDPESEIFDE